MERKFKISVLTPTYNRANLLKQLYNSLVNNSKYGITIEWLVMDDGSSDDTKKIVEEFNNNIDNLEIKYYFQENQGKMLAINNLVEKATGDLIVDCDSDDYFTDDAFLKIKKAYEKYEKEIKSGNYYGLCFLKNDSKENNMGNDFKNKETTMFDLYFKEGETGEKAIVFLSKIRKKYKHELEHGEKFVTEARMYHKIDEKYKIICINKPIMICEYLEDGYTKNINKQFIENKYGYFEYFKEILQKDMKNITFSKRLYVIKHYILFKYLTEMKKGYKYIKGKLNKFLYIMLYIPGIIKSRKNFKKDIYNIKK